MDNKELIWVEKEFAERYNEMEKESSKNEERLKALDDYIKTVSDESRSDFKANLGVLEEDVAVYKGLMLQVKQAFGKAKDEAIKASYALWEQYDKELPSVKKKVADIVESLEPLKKTTKEINDSLEKINCCQVDKVIEAIRTLNDLYGESKEMVDFLVKNFKPTSTTKEAKK